MTRPGTAPRRPPVPRIRWGACTSSASAVWGCPPSPASWWPAGVPVSGSDAKDLPVMAELAAAGARIAVGYGAANLGDAQTVVAGSAIRADNPELAAARAAGLPVLHRSEALAATMAQDTAVTVAGTHGKSTTTSMITVLLQGAGMDPSFADRRQRPRPRRQRRLRDVPGLRRGSRRIRRLVPELPPADRRGHQRRTGPPGPLRHGGSRLRLVRPVHRPAARRRPPGRLRRRRRRAGPRGAHPRTRPTPGWSCTAQPRTPM